MGMRLELPGGGGTPSRGSWGFLSSGIRGHFRPAGRRRKGTGKAGPAWRGLCFILPLQRGFQQGQLKEISPYFAAFYSHILVFFQAPRSLCRAACPGLGFGRGFSLYFGRLRTRFRAQFSKNHRRLIREPNLNPQLAPNTFHVLPQRGNIHILASLDARDPLLPDLELLREPRLGQLAQTAHFTQVEFFPYLLGALIDVGATFLGHLIEDFFQGNRHHDFLFCERSAFKCWSNLPSATSIRSR